MSDVVGNAPSGAKKAPQAGDVSGAVVPESDAVGVPAMLRYVEQLEAHLDEGGGFNLTNMRDLINMVREASYSYRRSAADASAFFAAHQSVMKVKNDMRAALLKFLAAQNWGEDGRYKGWTISGDVSVNAAARHARELLGIQEPFVPMGPTSPPQERANPSPPHAEQLPTRLSASTPTPTETNSNE